MKTIEINNTLDTKFLKINFHFLNVHRVRFKLASFTEQEITLEESSHLFILPVSTLAFFLGVSIYVSPTFSGLKFPINLHVMIVRNNCPTMSFSQMSQQFFTKYWKNFETLSTQFTIYELNMDILYIQ